MDIDQTVNQLVQNIVGQITTKVEAQVAAAMDAKIAQVINAIDTNALMSEKLNEKLDERVSRLPLDTKTIETNLSHRVNSLADNLHAVVQTKSLELANESIAKYIQGINFQQLCQATILLAMDDATISYKPDSIPANAIKRDDLKLSGSNISGGIITNFNSTGIEDQATACQVTILDSVTVVENNLLTRDLTVKGKTTIEGDLIVMGSIPPSSPMFANFVNAAASQVKASIDSTVFDAYSDNVFAKIKHSGLDLNKITINGQDLVDGGNLGNFVTSSNLQKIGVLNDLQVKGETLLGQTLWTSNAKRVGINTIEPTQALSLWDQEVEVGVGKQSTNTAVIETPRNQALVLSSNRKNNLTLTTDGAVTVNKINMGTMTFSVGDRPPTDNQPKGSVVFNNNPSLGGPLGWVSLGDARWANFGVID
jgi:hypothetical protein